MGVIAIGTVALLTWCVSGTFGRGEDVLVRRGPGDWQPFLGYTAEVPETTSFSITVVGHGAVCHHAVMAASLITVDPQRRGGRACVRDLRISVGDVLGWLAQGLTPEQIVAEYPELTHDDIRACLSYAAAREAHEVRLTAAA